MLPAALWPQSGENGKPKQCPKPSAARRGKEQCTGYENNGCRAEEPDGCAAPAGKGSRHKEANQGKRQHQIQIISQMVGVGEGTGRPQTPGIPLCPIIWSKNPERLPIRENPPH